MKLGKKPAKFDTRTLMFAKYTVAGLPTAPASVNYYGKVKKWPMMANDNYGDCTCAAAGHMIEEWTAYTRKKSVVLSDKQILDAYDYFSGGNPDAGANMLDVLNYWRKTGIGHDKISAYAQLEPKNAVQVKDSVYLFGTCYIGVSLPDFAVPKNGPDWNTIPWVVPPQGPTGNAKPNPDNGHCIPAVGYDERNLYIVTWGALKPMSWSFYQTYMDEAYAVLSKDWIDKKLKKAPPGFDVATLNADLSAVVTQHDALLKPKTKARSKAAGAR